MRLATTSLFFVVIGCTGDSPGGGGGGVDADIDPDPRLCVATLSTSGTFAKDASADPLPGSGCRPWGTWTFTTAIVSNNCSPAPSVQEYQFKATWKLDNDGNTITEYSYLTDPTTEHRIKHSQGGSGLCAGELQLYSADGKTVFNLRPELNADNSITGDGEYAVFTTDQRPF